MGPGRGCGGGADVLVIGRPITEARDPRGRGAAINAEIARGAGGLSHGGRGQDLRPDRPGALAAAVEGGARYLGFVFYPPSPRALVDRAGRRSGGPGAGDRTTVGVLVDPDDALLEGSWPGPARCPAAARRRDARSGSRAIKAATGRRGDQGAAVAEAEDLAPVPAYAEVPPT